MSAYRGASVAVTGGTGFIGARLIAALGREGAAVARLDRASACVTDHEALSAAMHAARPDIVFHLAASGVGDLFADQPGQVAVNVLGTVNVLVAAREAGVRRVVAFGTCFEYGASDAPLREDCAISPRNPYAASKAAAFAYVRHAADILGQDVVWLRPFAVYGPGQPPMKLVPALIEACLSGQALSLGAGTAVWDYVHVDDVVSAAMVVGAHEAAGRGIFNAGSGLGHSARQIASVLSELTGLTPRLSWGERPRRPGDPACMIADISRLRSLGWTPSIPLRDGLRGMIPRKLAAA